jgi:putative ABC transport system permease protein
VRASLGATRWRLIRQLLTESFVLAGAGCAAGCLFAWLGIRELVPLIPYNSFPQESVIALNGSVLAAAMGVAFLATMLCGLVPAIHAVAGQLQPRLAGAGTGSAAGLRHSKLRSALVVAEIGLAIVLMTGAGLMLRSFFSLTHQNLGYDPKSVLSLNLNFPANQYASAVQRKEFFLELLRRSQATPGVVNASAYGGDFTTISVTGGASHSEPWRSVIETVGAEYFAIHNQHLLQGRAIAPEDVFAGRRIAVVDEAFARKFLPKSGALGQKIDFADYDDYLQHPALANPGSAPPAVKPPAHTWFEVVGVIADEKYPWSGSDNPPQPDAFVPWTVEPLMVFGLSVRTSGNADRSAEALVQQVWAMNPQIQTGDPQKGETVSEADQFRQQAFAQPEFEFVMLATFASIGLLLVMIGVYSVMAYNVSLQTHETGIRMALGAQRGDILRSVLRKGAILIACGVGAGVFGAWGVTRFIRNQLWHVKPNDAWSFAGAILVVVLTGVLACLVPARRAMEVDPLAALRSE